MQNAGNIYIHQNAELHKTRQLFLQLLSNYPDGAISIINRDFNFVYTGGELHRFLNAEPVGLIGNSMYPKFPAPLREIIKRQLTQVFDGAVLSGFELPYPLKDQFYTMDAFPLKEDDGSIIYAGVIIRNISAVKKAEQELRHALEKAKELSEMKSNFVSMASHEFRTPLSTILSSVYLLEKYMGDVADEKRTKHVKLIVSSINTLTEILNDFLSVSKMEEGKISVNEKLLNVKQLVIDIINEVKNISKDGQRISYQHTGDEYVVLDPLLLKQIIMNLASNAIKFSGVNTVVEITTTASDSGLQLSVKDNGIGIPEKDRQHLFERFYRASNASNIQGTGLGLHLVARYTEMLGGSIKCNSVQGEGTEFIITFNN